MAIDKKYDTLIGAIEGGDVDAGVAEAKRLVADGISVAELFSEAISPCLADIGDRFSRLELFLPEMVLSADVVKGIHEALADTLSAGEEAASRGTVVIGTAYGDIHDIGKNIVAALLEVNGFKVIDLGIDVSASTFVERARAADADVIAISALMSTSMPYMSDAVEIIKGNEKDRDRFKVIIGGGPVNAEYATRVGADSYGDDAADAVRQIQSLLDGNPNREEGTPT